MFYCYISSLRTKFVVLIPMLMFPTNASRDVASPPCFAFSQARTFAASSVWWPRWQLRFGTLGRKPLPFRFSITTPRTSHAGCQPFHPWLLRCHPARLQIPFPPKASQSQSEKVIVYYVCVFNKDSTRTIAVLTTGSREIDLIKF